VPGAEEDEPLIWYEGSAFTSRRWLHADNQGSIIAYTDDATGAADAIYGYDAYGVPNARAGSRYRFTGQTEIPEAALYYYKARVYDPTLGRFLQTDPVGYTSDVDLYAYAGDDPADRSDPSGLDPTLDAYGLGQLIQGTCGGDMGCMSSMAAQLAQSEGAALGTAALNLIPFLGDGADAAEATEAAALTARADAAAARAGEVAAETKALPEGSFSIADWRGYPEGVPRPSGPFRVAQGEEYAAARGAANQANRALHQSDSALNGAHIHEIQPVKFGGSPTDPANKIPMTPANHAVVTNWWNGLLRAIGGG
jgi:RHS repeat-associated protein